MGVLVTSEQHPGMILVGKRLKPGFGQHTYALPGGHVEFGESFVDCGRRETQEECGITLRGMAVVPFTANVCVPEQQYHYIIPFVRGIADSEPGNSEPEKCAGWVWCKYPEGIPTPVFPSLAALVASGYSIE